MLSDSILDLIDLLQWTKDQTNDSPYSFIIRVLYTEVFEYLEKKEIMWIMQWKIWYSSIFNNKAIGRHWSI